MIKSAILRIGLLCLLLCCAHGTGSYADHRSIQATIDAAPSGSVIVIPRATYIENVVIDKPLTVIGQEYHGGYPVLDGNSGSYGFHVTSEGVTIKQFTVRNCVHGIRAVSGDTILSCEIRETDTALVMNGSHILAEANQIWNNGCGIWVSGTATAAENSIHDNIVSANGTGMLFSSTYADIEGNTVTENSVEENDEGIVLEFVCTDNLFTANTIRWNDITGFRLTPGASGNMIYHNDFQQNGQNAFDPSSNVWDNGYPEAGNYWDDYPGVDEDDDNIGDTPYPIPGGANVDGYPLMYRYVYQCGDANYSWQVDIDDVVYTLAYIFSGGAPPYPGPCVADTDGSGGVDIDDVVHLLAYIFGFGPAPAADCCETWW